jgi:hypothetical protein
LKFGGSVKWAKNLDFTQNPRPCALNDCYFKNSDTISPDSKMDGQRRSIRKLSEPERQRYCRWWKKYMTLKRVAQIGILVCLICGVFSFSEHENSHLARLILYPTFWLTVICAVWRTFLECPRCGEKFSGWWGSESDESSTSECQKCGLSCYDLSALSRL